MELVLATANLHKQKELVSLLHGLDMTILMLDEFHAVPSIIEDGESCLANAIKKATLVAKHTGKLALADDTGLEVAALGGRPGIYAARYAGNNATYEDNCRKLLEELHGVPLENRGARFLTVMVLAEASSSVEWVEGVLDGYIAEKFSGSEGFGYDQVFFLPELGKTLAELTLDQKNQISHRAKALQKVKAILKDRSKNFKSSGRSAAR